MQGEDGTNCMTPPMNAVKKSPMPKGFRYFAALEQQKTSPYVFVGIQQVVSDVTYNGFVVQRSGRIEVLTIIATIETYKVVFRTLQQTWGGIGQTIRVFRPELWQSKRGCVKPAKPRGRLSVGHCCVFTRSAKSARNFSEGIDGRIVGIVHVL